MREDRHFLFVLLPQFEGVMKLSAQAADDAHTLRRELAGEVLRSSGSLHLRVTGWSMLPTVWPGDTLVIEPASGDQVCEGDIVLFSSSRRFVAHRVVAVNNVDGLSIQTQGDALPYADATLAASDIMGKASLIFREGRRNENSILPSRRMDLSNRAAAAFFRRSSFAARAVVGTRSMLQKLYAPSSDTTLRVPASQIQGASI